MKKVNQVVQRVAVANQSDLSTTDQDVSKIQRGLLYLIYYIAIGSAVLGLSSLLLNGLQPYYPITSAVLGLYTFVGILAYWSFHGLFRIRGVISVAIFVYLCLMFSALITSQEGVFLQNGYVMLLAMVGMCLVSMRHYPHISGAQQGLVRAFHRLMMLFTHITFYHLVSNAAEVHSGSIYYCSETSARILWSVWLGGLLLTAIRTANQRMLGMTVIVTVFNLYFNSIVYFGFNATTVTVLSLLSAILAGVFYKLNAAGEHDNEGATLGQTDVNHAK